MMSQDNLERVMFQISRASNIELNEIVQAVTGRFRELHRGQRLEFLAVPVQDAEERRKTVTAFCEYLMKSGE